jgi:hypothetical protein
MKDTVMIDFSAGVKESKLGQMAQKFRNMFFRSSTMI